MTADYNSLVLRVAALEDRHRDEDLGSIRSDLNYVRSAVLKMQMESLTHFSELKQVLNSVIQVMATKDDVHGLSQGQVDLAGKVDLLVAWVNSQSD